LAAIHTNAEPLEETCKFLSSLLDKHRQLAHLPAYEELMHEGQIDRLSWFTLEGIWNWYKIQFDLLTEVWNQNKNLSVHKKIQRAKTYIQRNYQQDLTIECVGKEVGTSGEYIRHLFKEITGQTLIEYITEVRMEKAKQYIQTGNYKIYEISSLVGYKSGQYFAKVFKQFTGSTPQSFMEGNVKSRENKN